MSPEVVALGQPVACDDGVAFIVVDNLAQVAPHIPARKLSDTADLLTLLETATHVILVDAVSTEPEQVGAVMQLTEADLAIAARHRLSSHGLSASQAIALARNLNPHHVFQVEVVGIGILPPSRYGTELSEPVLGAIPLATQKVIELVERATHA